MSSEKNYIKIDKFLSYDALSFYYDTIINNKIVKQSTKHSLSPFIIEPNSDLLFILQELILSISAEVMLNISKNQKYTRLNIADACLLYYPNGNNYSATTKSDMCRIIVNFGDTRPYLVNSDIIKLNNGDILIVFPNTNIGVPKTNIDCNNINFNLFCKIK
jgi:hypothetical protein